MLFLNKLNVGHAKQIQTRHFWAWINIIFNKIDENRVKQFGPDRTCAEWLLRNGASVKWLKSEEFLKDYNSLPVEGSRKYIQEVDATESSIMHYGFGHFQGCKYINKIVLHKCDYLEDEALKDLSYLKDSLQHLQISSCGNITSSGLGTLNSLSNLKTLNMYDLPYVREKDKVVDLLQKSLKQCNITFK